MPNIFTHIDAWFIDKAERFSHWTQRCFGIASPTWERLFLFLCTAQFVSHEIPLDWWNKGFGKIWIFLDGLLIANWFFRFLMSYQRRSSGVGSGSEAVRNPEKLDTPHFRGIFCLLGLCVLPIDLWRYVGLGDFSHSLYFQCLGAAWVFSACDDLPWSRSKLREFLDSARGALAQLKPQPAEL